MRSEPAEELYLDLEEPVRNLSHMAAIASDLAYDLLDYTATKKTEGETLVITIQKRQHERLLFAISKVSDMADELDKKYLADWAAST